MIQRYSYGKPYDTGAVVRPVRAQDGALPYFSVSQRGDAMTYSLTLHPDEMIFGLGEQTGSINRRGQFLRSWNTDQSSHTEDQPSLYASHNLLLFTSPERLFGVYFDDPGEMTFDLGWTDGDRVAITSVGGNLNVYILTAETLTTICREFRGLTGRSFGRCFSRLTALAVPVEPHEPAGDRKREHRDKHDDDRKDKRNQSDRS